MVRVAFGEHGALGPGKVRLLELIDAHGSITAAAKAMGISYRRAWLLVEGMKQAFRDPVVATQHGGAKGGGAGLTQVGRDIVERYRAIEQTARTAVNGQLRSLRRALRS
jgi:molybdate transport system regulatory protein